jgi:hypothetical protein
MAGVNSRDLLKIDTGSVYASPSRGLVWERGRVNLAYCCPAVTFRSESDPSYFGILDVNLEVRSYLMVLKTGVLIEDG